MDFGALIEKFVIWLCTFLRFWVVIEEYERAARLTLGRNPVELKPGFHLLKPFFIHTLHTDNVKPDVIQASPIYVTTSDQKTIVVTPVIEYEIEDIIKWAILTNDARNNLKDISCGVAADCISDISWEECKKKGIRTEIKKKINERVKSMGGRVTNILFKDISIVKLIITRV